MATITRYPGAGDSATSPSFSSVTVSGVTGTTLAVASTQASTAPNNGAATVAGGFGADHIETYVLNARSRVDAALGAELITNSADRDFSSDTGNWTGTGWTVGSNVYTHVAGANAATLAGYAATAGTVYQITITINTTTVGTVTVGYGGATARPVGYTTGTLTTLQFILPATTTGGLVVTPNSTWAGTIDNVSIVAVTTASSPVVLKNNAGTATLAIKVGPTDSVGIGNATLVGTSGANTVAFGASAGSYSSSSNSVYLGSSAGANGVGTGNVAVGYQSGYQHVRTNGSFFGYQSGYQNAGASAVAIGYRAGYQNTGDTVTLVGSEAGASNTGGSCTAVGYFAGNLNMGLSVAFVGQSSGISNAGTHAVGVGQNSLAFNVGASCVSMGSNTLSYNTGFGNIQIGYVTTLGLTKIQLLKGSWAAATSGAGTTVETGRTYRVAAVIGGVETELSLPITGTGAAGAQYDHTGVPVYTGPKTCTARKIYRQNSTDRKWYLVGTIADNVTTTFTDTQATATFGAVNTSPTGSAAIGVDAIALKSGDLVLGSSSYHYADVYFGGVYHATTNNNGASTTLHGMGGNGTDKNGGMLTIAPGLPTGTGISSVRIQSANRTAATGAVENAVSDRIIVPSRKHLTDNTVIGLFEVTLASGATAGGSVDYAIHCSDGTDHQVHTGLLQFLAINKAGTVTTAVGHASAASGLEVDLVTSGTITDTFTVAAGTGKATISVNANSSLTPTVLYIDYVIHNNSGAPIIQL